MMMDNATHHQVVQLNTTNPQNINNIQQQQTNNKIPGEPDHFLTIRLLMQGKVSCLFLFNKN
jgi:hypothetical protein